MISNYSEIRDKIKSGDVIAWKGKTIYSKIVSLATQSEFTHVAIAWVIGKRVFVFYLNSSSHKNR